MASHPPQAEMPEYTQEDMHDASFNDLSIRLDTDYVFLHQVRVCVSS